MSKSGDVMLTDCPYLQSTHTSPTVTTDQAGSSYVQRTPKHAASACCLGAGLQLHLSAAEQAVLEALTLGVCPQSI